MVHRAIEIADELSKHSIDTAVVDLFRLKPLNENILLKIMDHYRNILTLEEHFLTGGLGSAIAEILCRAGSRHRPERLYCLFQARSQATAADTEEQANADARTCVPTSSRLVDSDGSCRILCVDS
jgi:transketolase C-terminal domain/subunit